MQAPVRRKEKNLARVIRDPPVAYGITGRRGVLGVKTLPRRDPGLTSQERVSNGPKASGQIPCELLETELDTAVNPVSVG